MKLKILLRKIKSFIFKISIKEKINIIKAFIYSAIARIYIFKLPFNKLKKRMGNIKVESDKVVDKECEKVAKSVAATVRFVSNRTPWESKCLVQALTAQWMLRDKGIVTTLYLGVKKDMQGNMLAHAWTRCGQFYVTGGKSKEGYTVVAKFTSIVSKNNKKQFMKSKKTK